MIDNKYLKHLIESPLVYYVYQRDLSIYEVNSKESNINFLVIIDEAYEVPKEFKQYKVGSPHNKIKYRVEYNGCSFLFYEMQDWFKQVLNCSLEAWECACLDKKFIYKEHVKLMMTTDFYKLREWFDTSYKSYINRYVFLTSHNRDKEARETLWTIIKSIKLINQILISHKIVNFKEASPEYDTLMNYEGDPIDKFQELLCEPLKYLKKTTDGIKKQKKLAKFIETFKDGECNKTN